MTCDEIRQLVLKSNPVQFVENHIFDRIPALFNDDRTLFIKWKRELANKLEVDPACITLVGSAAVGASLNPNKNYKLFDAESDVDVAIISQHHFSVAWRYLRMNPTRRLRVDQRTKNAWDEHVRRYIYWGTIATDRLLGVLPFGPAWLKASSALSLTKPTEGRTINFRLYSDFDALRAYHVQSLRNLREPSS